MRIYQDGYDVKPAAEPESSDDASWQVTVKLLIPTQECQYDTFLDINGF